MRQISCAACQANVPMSEAFSIAERSLCMTCADQFVKERGKGGMKRGEISRLVDPTICVHCSADGGQEEWPTVANLPACTKCENFIRNRPYPGWLKISFVVFMCVAVAAFVYNMRFFLAYVEIVQANHALKEGRIQDVIKHYAAAGDRMPEVPELAIYKAQQLASEDKDDEATAIIRKWQGKMPPHLRESFHEVELNVQMSQAFDRHDYDAFLDLAQQLVRSHPDDSSYLASVASAYACKYAKTGDAKFRDEAKQTLDQAREHAGNQMDEFKEYESRILYRLQTREIITEKQFHEKFPNGWKPEGDK